MCFVIPANLIIIKFALLKKYERYKEMRERLYTEESFVCKRVMYIEMFTLQSKKEIQK